MLRSLKLNAPGPKLGAARWPWPWGLEVYMSFRPHPCMKEEGCIAASGEEASIIDMSTRGEGYYYWSGEVFVQSIESSREVGSPIDNNNC